MPGIKTVGICSKPNAARASEVAPRVIEWLQARQIEVRADEETAVCANCGVHGIAREQVPDGCDLIIVLGGDGTLLSAARAIGRREIPLFPVNLGGLGFLTAISVEELFPELEKTLSGELRVARRRLISAEVVRDHETVAHYDALNDAVLGKTSLARIIDLEVYVDKQFVSAYKADGLIVATPTGSTAYSLAAGGPIIYPTVPAICLTPICPHMLTNRPLIVAETSVIEILSNGTEEGTYLTIDGQVGTPLNKGDRVVCRSSDFSLLLIRPPRMQYFDVLRQKLKWGER